MSVSCSTAIALTLVQAGQASPQQLLLHEIFKQLLAVQRDHRDTLQVGAVQPLVERDVALQQLEVVIGADAQQHAARLLAQVTARAGVQRDALHSGRSPVAYASRPRYVGYASR